VRVLVEVERFPQWRVLGWRAKSDICAGGGLPFRRGTEAWFVFGSTRSWPCGETVGTAIAVWSALRADWSWGSRGGSFS
jgi:hypothetical protein